ncbi:hypothetical protein [Runella aurantiaca]|uniref:DUF4347 domain-containing protein n=1 Tax=Runella aurantiaca TaxID=2282308 RepID=A0A369I0Y2_9BACT|nr:hypothetical protein [Runella aurantiaca]RDB03429.1 hypothetical protein DVG78_24095 [Runella aurantiaca]
MAKNMILHDTRLGGSAPSGLADNIFKVNEKNDTAHIFQWIATYARSQGGLDNLFIMCHGGTKEKSEMVDGGASAQSRVLKERGLQIGAQNLLHSNLNVTAVLNGLVAKITVFACNIAETDKGSKLTADDGKLFCKYLAVYTGAEVIASSETQKYHKVGLLALFSDTAGTIDFGAWEGPVFSFLPDGKLTPLK